MKNAGKIGVGILVLVVLVAIGLLYTRLGRSSTTTINYQPVFLTDPPSVPAGTSALIINYSLLRVHFSNGADSGWVQAPYGNGSINLLNIINSSQLMGIAVVPVVVQNATIDEVRFDIFSASITVNGTTTNVIVPNREVTVRIVGRNELNATTGVIIDLSPTIITVYNNSSVGFVLVPSVRGIVVSNNTLHAHLNLRVGEKIGIGGAEKAEIERARPNITITSASLSTVGNSTRLSVTVRDNSNQSVVLHDVILFGNEDVHITPFNGINSTARGSFGLGIAGSLISSRWGIGTGQNASFNATAHTDAEVHGALGVGIVAQSLRTLNFLVTRNGTLVMPRTVVAVDSILQQGGGFGGYNLSTGATATFIFNGPISYGFGHVTVKPTVNSTYRLVISGEEGARATASVVAT